VPPSSSPLSLEQLEAIRDQLAPTPADMAALAPFADRSDLLIEVRLSLLPLRHADFAAMACPDMKST
jgi:hypothetical protein